MSIIEVMTAIVVAMVGVFGVMVLIPFAVRQAESGLNRDHATAVARNAMESFDTMGFRSPGRWVTGVANDLSGIAPQPRIRTYANNPPIVPICLDPIWVNANAAGGSVGPSAGGPAPNIVNNFGLWGDGPFVASADPDMTNASSRYGVYTAPGTLVPATTHPFRGQVDPPLPANLRIQRTSLTDGFSINNSMGDQLVRRLFQSSDELVFSQYEAPETGPDAGLTYPAQLFLRDAAGNPLRSQAEERLSWSVFVVPEEPSLGRYRMATLVYVDRTAPVFIDPGTNSQINNAAIMASAVVTAQPGSSPPLFSQRMGFEIALGKVDWSSSPTPPVPPTDPTNPNDFQTIEGDVLVPGVNRDDWVMLTNFLPAGYPLGSGTSDRQQIRFYRVVSVDAGDSPRGVFASISLDGPEFDFGPDANVYPTYVVHLRDVINVYERLIFLEADSDWSFASN